MLINKVLTTVAPPVGATVGLVRAGMAACQCGTIGGGIVMAAGTQVLTSIVTD